MVGDYRRHLGLMAAIMLIGAAALLFLSQLVVVSSPAVDDPPPEPVPPNVCISPGEHPFFYANSIKKEGPNSFGPAVNAKSVAKAKQELLRRLCGRGDRGGDKSLYKALTAVADFKNPNRRITHKMWRRGAEDFTERLQWQKARIVEMSYTNRGSFYMKPRGSKTPIVGVDEVSTPGNKFLVLPVDNGSRLVLRLRCGFQPVFKYW